MRLTIIYPAGLFLPPDNGFFRKIISTNHLCVVNHIIFIVLARFVVSAGPDVRAGEKQAASCEQDSGSLIISSESMRLAFKFHFCSPFFVPPGAFLMEGALVRIETMGCGHSRASRWSSSTC